MGSIGSGTGSKPATAEDLQIEQTLRQQLGQLSVPLLQRQDNPNQYLYFAFLDGTGQDLNNPDLGAPTTIGLAFRQAERVARDPESRVGAHYSKGIGTQENAVGRAIDGALAYSYRDGIEEAYTALAIRTRLWKQENPNAEIHVVGAGYSREQSKQPACCGSLTSMGLPAPLISSSAAIHQET